MTIVITVVSLVVGMLIGYTVGFHIGFIRSSKASLELMKQLLTKKQYEKYFGGKNEIK